MTNPETYFRDTERIENEMSSCGRCEGRQSRPSTRSSPTGRERRYSRETLPSGCILYSLRAEKTITGSR